MKSENTLRLLCTILATLLPIVASILQWMVWPAIQPYVWFLFYPAVFFSSWVGGLPGRMAATVISAALIWWVFIPTVYASAQIDPMTLVSVAVFMAMGALFSISHGRLRKANRNAAKALELRPDLIVSDVMMPRMSGGQMVEALRRHREMDDVPIVMLTAKADDALRVKSPLRAGTWAC